MDGGEIPYTEGYPAEGQPGDENVFSPRYYLRILAKRIKLVLSCMFLGVVIGVIHVARTEPIYEAKAQLLFSVGPPSKRGEIVDKDYAGVGLSSIFEQDSYISTQMELLKGRGLARAVVERLHLENSDEFKPRPPGALSRTITAVKKAVLGRIWTSRDIEKKPPSGKPDISGVVAAFADRIGVSRIGKGGKLSGSRMVEVTFTGRDKEAIKRILNTTLEVFKEQDLERRYKAVREVLSWLQSEQRKAQAAIEEAEGKVQEYVEKEKMAIVPASRGESDTVDTQKLGSLSEAIIEASTKRIQAETLYRNLVRLAESDQALPTEGESEVIQELKKQYAQLQTRRAALGKRFGDKWPEIRDLDEQMAAIKTQIRQERQNIVAVAKASYELAKQQEDELKRALELQKKQTIELRRKAVMYRQLKREAESNEQLFATLLRNMKEARVAESIDRSQISIETPAYISREKHVARAKKTAYAIVFLAFFGGFGLAVLLERTNPTIESEEEAELCLGIPLLGSLARIDKQTLRENGRVVPVLVRDEPRSLYSEQFQRITANALAHAFSEEKKSLVVTSISPKEGKSLIAANLAACLAKVGKKVLLIDADMHQPTQHAIFGCENKAGFAVLLRDGTGAENGIRSTDVANLFLLVAGEKEARHEVMPVKPGDVTALLETLKKEFEILILDCAPVGVVADALSLSQVADGVLLVVKSGGVTKLMGRHVIRQLEAVKADLVGVVLNEVVPRKRGSRYYYYYYYPYRYYSYYGADDESKKVKKKKRAR